MRIACALLVLMFAGCESSTHYNGSTAPGGYTGSDPHGNYLPGIGSGNAFRPTRTPQEKRWAEVRRNLNGPVPGNRSTNQIVDDYWDGVLSRSDD